MTNANNLESRERSRSWVRVEEVRKKGREGKGREGKKKR